MITIELGNSYSKIIGLDIGQEKQLREILSFTVGGKSAYFGRGYARKKSMLSKRCEFPTGLIHRTLLWGKSLSPRHSIQIKDKRIGNFPQKFSGPVRTWPDYYKTTNSYPAQLAAVKAAHHAVFGRGIIAMPTGTWEISCNRSPCI